MSMFRVTGLKILGRVGTHIFFNYFFFSGKKLILCILKGISPFKMHKIIFLPENLEKFYLGRVGLPLTQVFFFFCLTFKKY